MRPNAEACLPKLAMMEYLAGRLGPDQEASVREHMLACEACVAYARHLRDTAVADDLPPETIRVDSALPLIEKRYPSTKKMPAAVGVGAVIRGRYRLEESLGMGGMGEVFAAVELAVGRRVAIKIVNTELAASPEAVARFGREARAMAMLESEYAVRVYDTGKLPDGRPFLVMDQLMGVDLGAVLDEHGPLPADDALLYVAQACDALSEAHDKGVVHRDLKPRNLFLVDGRDGKTGKSVRVLDFGLARSFKAGQFKLETITRYQSLIGTMHYMPPEQIRNSTDVDPRSDVWSMGVTLYRLLTGRLPFVGRTEGDLVAAILHEPMAPLCIAGNPPPEPIAAIIEGCLEKDRERRIQTAATLGQLARAARGVPQT